MKTTDQTDDLQTSDSPPSIDDAPRLRRIISRPESARSFGRTLRELRRRRKLTLSYLASFGGVSASYLSRIENGRLPPPSAKIMHRLAMALNTEVSALQTAAGLLPERISAVLRTRPAVLTFLSLIGRLPDSELLDLCDDLLKRRELPN